MTMYSNLKDPMDKLGVVLATIIGLLLALLFYSVITAPEAICKSGYVFTNSTHPVQILDENGKGIKCTKEMK